MVVAVDVERQPCFFVPLLAGIAQIECHIGRVAEHPCRCTVCLHIAVGPRGRVHFTKPREQPLPGYLALCIGKAPWRVQVVGVDGIQTPVDLRRYGQ